MITISHHNLNTERGSKLKKRFGRVQIRQKERTTSSHEKMPLFNLTRISAVGKTAKNDSLKDVKFITGTNDEHIKHLNN